MGNKEKNFVSAVVYVHNAEDRIERFLKIIISVLEENFDHSEIICVNDSSEDGSLSAVKAAAGSAVTTSVSVVNMSSFHGIEAAVNAGVDLAIGDFVFEFDHTCPDYDRSEIIHVYRRALEGYDIVSAAPGRKEKVTSRLFYRIFNRFSGASYRMRTESFRILSRRLINRATSMNKNIPYRKAVYANAGLKADTLVYRPVSGGKEPRDRKERRYRAGLAVDSLLLFTEIGYRFALAMTFLMMLASVFMLAYSVIVYAAAHPVAGWTTTVLFLSVAFFGLFGILTVVIKYLQLLLNLIFKKKYYSFESIEKLTK